MAMTVTLKHYLLTVAWLLALGAPARADESGPDESDWYSLHAQFTGVMQFHPGFTSPYRGPNSLDPGNRGDETTDATLFAGIRLRHGVEFYADPEIDQGFGLSDTLGVAGFPSGEAYKVGAAEPYVRLARAFFRGTIDLGDASDTVESDQNQIAGTRSPDNVTVTIGKFSVVDIFDTNSYAHDPKKDFLNWSIIDAGAYDYAADAWGYSYGAAVEWTQSWWTVRAGGFDLSRVPNSKFLERGFGQFELDTELEARGNWFGGPGKIKLLAYLNRARMADYADAIRLGEATGGVPDVALVRRYAGRPGFILNAEQLVTGDLGAFLRASIDDGYKEVYEFTEINKSVSLGLSLAGKSWDRADDTLGLAGVVNELSSEARAYLAAGGLGILIGDGQLPHYGCETSLETYYRAQVVDGLDLSLDYQLIVNPAYNQDRGPVSVLGVRIHAEI
jgi:high affinity Mn2+ porin